MEPLLAITVATLFGVSTYLMLSKSIIRLLIGVVVLGNATNLLIFTAGRVTREVPPIVPPGLEVPAEAVANPLPQALILTAIVISFALFAFVLVLAYRAYEELGTDSSDEMRVAEPRTDRNA
ncbi:Na+/H+ antiporter subunit C [Kaustia mangrovi]|uniref:Na+/H+ antiporter subunit C n=1 Tax=Kaustia mangrovi TaxID=2593653 RepID=A0A7S8HB05_9HYPH|nr:Na+/H+ antiporter subunit C [Kaustia mangrovi]QPC42016.1 Na+/H+ antiporter subunit C [Kaustia mangrovi]